MRVAAMNRSKRFEADSVDNEALYWLSLFSRLDGRWALFHPYRQLFEGVGLKMLLPDQEAGGIVHSSRTGATPAVLLMPPPHRQICI